ncbi:MAG: mechanosensitive ion channel domain-containing protein [Candidatus Promineifilaceae bacterium]
MELNTDWIASTINLLPILFIGWALLRYLPTIIDKGFDLLPSIDKTWGLFVFLIVVALVGILLVSTGLTSLNTSPRVLEIVYAIGAPAIIFTYKDWLKDGLAGIGLQIHRQLHIGDWITVSDKMGRIARLGLFRTTLHTLGLDEITIRNSELFDANIFNHSSTPFFEIKMIIHTAGYADYQHDMRAYLAEVEAIAQRVQEQVSPAAAAQDRLRARAYLLEFGGSSDIVTVISYASLWREAISETHTAMAEALRSKGVVLGQVNANTFDNVMAYR